MDRIEAEAQAAWSDDHRHRECMTLRLDFD